MKQTDQIVKNVIDKFAARSAQGIAKYGTTLADNNTDDFLTHLQEELMDAVLYIEKLKQSGINAIPCIIIGQVDGNKFTDFAICQATNERIKLIPSQQNTFKTPQSAFYVLVDEFTNPELFECDPIFTDKRYAKIIH